MRNYKAYLLTVLMASLALSYVDRTAFGLLLQEIKVDFQLSDTQLGVLNGAVFALFFAAMGVPIARWSDRGNRVAIVSLAAAVWSVTVAMCSVATNFLQLVLLRIGTAAGEAGCTPPAVSLIPEYYSRSDRPRAMSRYMLGISIGLIAGYFSTGWLSELVGWRMTFLIIGLPGLALAALAILTLEEPRRLQNLGRGAPAMPGAREVLARMKASPTFRHLMWFYIAWYFCGWAFVQWEPAFFIRSHGMSTGELGTWLAVAYGGGNLVGTWLGGEFSSRYAARNEGLQLTILAGIFLLVAVLYVGVHLAPSAYAAMAFLTLTQLGVGMANGPLFAAIQSLVPARMRATAVVLVSLFPSFIGMGLGPLAVGALSDALQPASGSESLRHGLLVLCPGFVWAAWHLWRAGQTVDREIDSRENAYATY